MFLVRYATNAAGTTFAVARITPAPLEAIYPEDTRSLNTLTTQDGFNVIQRPSVDNRPREWGWVGYRPETPGYAALWTLLLSLDAKQRRINGLPQTIQIWEGITGAGGFGDLTSGTVPDTATAIATGGVSNLKWTTVRVVQVTRLVDRSSGMVRYDRTFIRFFIEDSLYTYF